MFGFTRPPPDAVQGYAFSFPCVTVFLMTGAMSMPRQISKSFWIQDETGAETTVGCAVVQRVNAEHTAGDDRREQEGQLDVYHADERLHQAELHDIHDNVCHEVGNHDAALKRGLARSAAVIRNDRNLVVDAHVLEQLHGGAVVYVVGAGAADGNLARVCVYIVDALLCGGGAGAAAAGECACEQMDVGACLRPHTAQTVLHAGDDLLAQQQEDGQAAHQHCQQEVIRAADNFFHRLSPFNHTPQVK